MPASRGPGEHATSIVQRCNLKATLKHYGVMQRFLNSTYNKLSTRGVEINFARTTTGDGYCVWNRDRLAMGPQRQAGDE